MGYEDLFNIAVAKNPQKHNCTELSKNEVFAQKTKSQVSSWIYRMVSSKKESQMVRG